MILGSDIKIDFETTEIPFSFNGLDTVENEECALQDIIIRLLTPKGSLFYDEYFGSRLHEFIQEAKTRINILDFEIEIKETIKQDPRVDKESIEIETSDDEDDSLVAKVSFSFIKKKTKYNLVIETLEELQIRLDDGTF
ncbi:MAG: hypothetical protein A2Z98_12620 [Spirochaetes bacterium GWB1_27_13]|nr:MAG: hypothetical protein A2Z98_12620 [Spirochaetes bacterium GWB1_27_13]